MMGWAGPARAAGRESDEHRDPGISSASTLVAARRRRLRRLLQLRLARRASAQPALTGPQRALRSRRGNDLALVDLLDPSVR